MAATYRYNSIDVANYFLNRAAAADSSITNLKLQKIVYIAHGVHLARTEKPLLMEQVECWKFGPVIGDLYHQFKHYGAGEIRTKISIDLDLTNVPTDLSATNFNPSVDFSKQAIESMDFAWTATINSNGAQLSNWSHKEGSPWRRAFDEGKSFIPDDYIKEYFYPFVKKPEQAKAS